jgi:hypothetical protein
MNMLRAMMAATCLLAGGCASLAPAAPPAAAAAIPPAPAAAASAPSRAERVAEALAMAAAAEQASDAAALAQATQQLERLGAAPQNAGDKAVLARWLAALPADAAPLRGRTLGPAYRSAALDPGGVTELNQTFFGGRSAQIVVRALRGPAPRLVVHDQANREVCKADDDPATCRWVPLYTQRHRIRIANDGPRVSEFYIVFD